MSDTPKRALSPAGDSVEDGSKRAKIDSEPTTTETQPAVTENLTYPHTRPGNETIPQVISKMGLKPILPVMPPSLELVTGVKADLRVRKGFVGQEEVGILGYAGDPDFKGVRGVIKQRFTDFLVNEVGLDDEVLRLKSIGKPVDPYDMPKDRSKGKEKEKEKEEKKEDPEVAPATETKEEVVEEKKEAEPESDEDLPETLRFKPLPLWTATTTRALRPIFSDECIVKLYALLQEGKEPPPKVDAGWGTRKARTEVASGNEEAAMNVDGMRVEDAPAAPSMYGDRAGGRGQGRDRGRGRGGRGGRGGGRAGDNGQWMNATKDDREVLSQQMTRDDRTKAHQVVREVFKGTFETSAKEIPGEENQRIALKWSKGGPATRRPEKPKDRPKPPPYIHFTLHKTNRDTQDCLSHLSRALGCKPQDLSVCGTKDKRAVTVQRVCFKRSGKNLVGVWRTANGIRPGRRTEQQAVEERGERGCRIGDLTYSEKYLELGMLKGNNFAITLRSVQSEATREQIDAHLLNIRTKGFVNFYGMQRFGTSTVPTHITGLFILQSKWSEAVDSILSLREGEHPECVRARLAWLEDEDLEGALQLMPRRCVAERSIWEHWRRSDRKDKLGALGTIPRNLRTMYVHAYQSYIWNLVTSERIKLSSTEPLVGDLVFADKSADDEVVDETAKGWRPSHQNSSSQEVKQLTEEDLGNYTIHDVIMPLPGWNIDYPAGDIGELYTKILKEDGLDPKRMQRDQREYSLPGSYRKIIHLPKTFTWSHVSYTDPDISLVQSDEDKILGENPAAEDDPEGKFQALKIELTLGPSAYATMALREITREETSTWHQIGLTMKGQDQEFKGAAAPGPDAVEDTKTEEVKMAEEVKSEEVKAEEVKSEEMKAE